MNDVLAFRALRHGFGATPPHDALLTLGVQDTPVGSAALALSARGLTDRGTTMVWSFRGAPHRQRTADLKRLAAALWPRSDADAYSRLTSLGSSLKKAGRSGVEAFALTAAAVAGHVRDGMPKGELSAAVTKAIPGEYSSWCRGCGATHVHDGLFRLAAFPGGARLDASTPMTFGRIPRWSPPSEPKGTLALLQAYADVHGPCTAKDAAAYLGTAPSAIRDLWADVAQPEPSGDPGHFTRLLAPHDPYLQMRDRDLLVPDPKHRKALWAILAGPGAVVVDSEVVGTWRAKTGKKALAITVTPWRRFRRDGIEEEAARVAHVRGAPGVTVTYDD